VDGILEMAKEADKTKEALLELDVRKTAAVGILMKVYRKEELGDDRLSRAEVLDRVWDEICNNFWNNNACEWADDMRFEIDNGNSD